MKKEDDDDEELNGENMKTRTRKVKLVLHSILGFLETCAQSWIRDRDGRGEFKGEHT